MSSQSSGSEQEKSHEQFIEAVKKHEVIYRPDHEYYRDKNKRQIAWEQVVAECGMTSILEAKTRLTSLRGNLTDALKKPTRQHWRYMNQLEFLIPYIGKRKRRDLETVDLTAEDPDTLDLNNYSHEDEDDEYLNFIAENNFSIENLPKDNALHTFFVAMYKVVHKLPDIKKPNVKKKILDIVKSTRDIVREKESIKRSLVVSNLVINKSKKLCLSSTMSGSTTNVPSNQQQTEKSENKGSELNILPKVITSTTSTNNGSNVFSNQMADTDLNGKSFFPITNSSTAKTTIIMQNKVHTNLAPHKGPEINLTLPNLITSAKNYTSIFSQKLQPEQTKNESSDLNVIPNLATGNIPTAKSDLIISNVAHIEQSKHEGFGIKTTDGTQNQLQTTKTLQHTKAELSSNSFDSTPITHDVGFTGKENVKKEMSLVYFDEDAKQAKNSSTNCDDIFIKIKVEKDNKDEKVLSEASFSDVEIISEDDIEIEVSDGE